MLDHRAASSSEAAVEFAGWSMPSYDRALATSPSGCTRQGYDLQLTRYDDRGWGATFYTTEMEHSPNSATGTAWERTPWRATQRAGWETPHH
jgi:hypothetical protein